MVSFVAGVLVGVALGCSFFLFPYGRFHLRGARPPEEILLERIARKIGLDNAQREKVRPIVSELAATLETIRHKGDSKVEASIRAAAVTADPILRPEQREKLREFLARAP